MSGESVRRDPAAEWPAAPEGADDDPHDALPEGAFAMPAEPEPGVPPAGFSMPATPPGGLEDAACPAFDGGVLAVVYQLKAEFVQHCKDWQGFRDASTSDRADMRRMLQTHTRDEAPRLAAIQTRLNVCLSLVLAVGLFALAGPEGLRQIGDVVSRNGTLGFDGIVTLAGTAIPLLYPLGRRIFLQSGIRNQEPGARSQEPGAP